MPFFVYLSRGIRARGSKKAIFAIFVEIPHFPFAFPFPNFPFSLFARFARESRTFRARFVLISNSFRAHIFASSLAGGPKRGHFREISLCAKRGSFREKNRKFPAQVNSSVVVHDRVLARRWSIAFATAQVVQSSPWGAHSAVGPWLLTEGRGAHGVGMEQPTGVRLSGRGRRWCGAALRRRWPAWHLGRAWG